MTESFRRPIARRASPHRTRDVPAMSASYIEESKKGWHRSGDQQPSTEDLQLGCLQRIAAAVELSCKDRERLERDYKYMRERRDEAQRTAERLARSNAALRGVIKRMKAERTALKLAMGDEG